MKALIAMSGGVDSSVAALVMKEKGYECIGCTMKLYTDDDIGNERSRTCCSLDDVEDARAVAGRIGIPYYVLNFTGPFRAEVIDRFISRYEEGLTPNPCIDCNRYMKFEMLYERAAMLGCDRIVTGHYARIRKSDTGYELLKGIDESKDQSYVLYQMTQEQLAHTEFPLGEMTKDAARNKAEEYGFVNADKPDSQDICFVPDGDYVSAIKRLSGKDYPEGDFVDSSGNVLGTHRGIIAYTIGQRKGLGISAGTPIYVTEIDPEKNQVVLGEQEDLYSKTAYAGDVNWISGNAPSVPFECTVKARYRMKEARAIVYPEEDGRVRIEFIEPQRAVTPGQAAVFYDGEKVLGGGVILKQNSDMLPPLD